MLLYLKLHTPKRYGPLILLFFLISPRLSSQTISFSVDRESLSKVLSIIEKQTSYNFIYSEEVMKLSKPVTLQVKNESLSNVLTLTFKGQPLSYITEDKHIVIHSKPPEKPVEKARELRGRVVNEKGEPVAGISITIKGANLITASNSNGEFYFANAPDLVTLIISGAETETQELQIGSQIFAMVHIAVKLGTLDETVVIAYGESTRRYNTGSVSSVKATEIAKQPVPNILSVLTGRVAGLQVTQNSGVPGSGIQVKLRGTNSIANGNDPLYVIDGVPFPSFTFNTLVGSAGGTTLSSFNNINPADIESVDILKDADATAIYGSRGANGVILITTKKGIKGKTQLDLRINRGYGGITRKIPLPETKQYLAMRREAFSNDGTIPNIFDAWDLLVWDTTRFTDWQEELIGGTMKMMDANLSLSGGSEQTQFLFTSGYTQQSSTYPGDFGDKRYMGGLTINHRSSDKRFYFSGTFNYTLYKNILPQEDLSRYIFLAPNAPPIYDDEGNFNWAGSTWTNPMAFTEATYTNRSQNLITNLNAGYRIGKGLELKFSGGINSILTKDIAQNPQVSMDPAFGLPSSAVFGRSDILTLIAEPQAQYSKALGLHNLSFLVGSTFQQTTTNSLTQSGSGYASDDLLESIKAAPQVTTLGESAIRYRYAGLFARLNYDFKKRYLFNLTVRRDGSSRYGEESRFANFGSAGAAWIFSSESWMKSVNFLSFGKLRASGGLTGNDQIGDYKYFNLYTPINNTYQGIIPFYPEQLYNPLYSWEKVRKLEGALELGFLNNRFLLTASYYHHATSNQLVTYPLPNTTGFSAILRNIPAKIENTGWEFEIHTINVKAREFNWSTSATFAIPRNKLVSFENLSTSTYATQYVIGEPLTIAKRYELLGVDPATGIYTFRDFNGDGQITATDRQYIIFTGQQFYGGLENNLVWGKWNLSFLFQFVGQKNASNFTQLTNRPMSISNQPEYVLDRWQPNHTNAFYQRYTVSNAAANNSYAQFRESNGAYSNASMIRLRNLSLGFDLLGSKWKAHGINAANVFVQGNNLATITNYPGLDPESRSLLPPIKMITAGFQLTF